MKTFQELGLSPEILQAIEELGYAAPMPVQEEVIPHLLGQDTDIVALAQTGTGKTAAFGLPLLQNTDPSRKEPQALVLCPTRELCLQIAGDLTDYSKYMPDLRVLPVYGGSSIESQIRALKRGVHIIVATPGRLLDLMQRRTVSLQAIRNVVMDEADEMLNMGFSESINAILAEVPRPHNTLLFSATMSPEIARIAKQYLHEPIEVTIGRKNESTANVKHYVYAVHAKDKYETLKRIVDYYPDIYGIIFCRTRKETQEIADKLMQEGYNADSLHGELSQAQRDLVMQKFRIRNLQLLVATDVAARGLDVDDLTHVLHYGLPDEVESYTHRSGRTGRAGKTGTSIAIINLKEKGKLREIERVTGKTFETGAMPTAKQICEKQLLKVIDDLEKVKVQEEDIADFMPDVLRKLEWLSKEDLIKRMMSHEFNRFAEYYRHRPEIKTVSLKSDGKKKDKAEKGKKAANHKAEAGYSRLFINVGKADGFFPNDLFNLINANIHGRVPLGRIDILKTFAFFEVPEEEATHVIRYLNRARWQGRRVSVELADTADGSQPEKPARKKDKPARSKKKEAKPKKGKKDDWRQFFQHDDD